MENQVVFEMDIELSRIKSVIVNEKLSNKSPWEEHQTIEFTFYNDRKILFDTVHSVDCCESVYADFGYFDKESVINKRYYDKITIKKIEGEGMLFVFGRYLPAKFFVPCYNAQNGYYSSNLTLLIFDNGKKIAEIDLANMIEHYEN